MKEEVLQIKTMGEKINNLFKDAYKRHLILVNRKYQRKLVWTIEEKRAFIDTLLLHPLNKQMMNKAITFFLNFIFLCILQKL